MNATAIEWVTIKRTFAGVWMKMFDNYETSFRRISEKEAIESINLAREQGRMVADDDEKKDSYLMFAYTN